MRKASMLLFIVMLSGALGAETHVIRTTSAGKVTTTSTEVVELASSGGVEIREKSEEGSWRTLIGPDDRAVWQEIAGKDGSIRMVSDGRIVSVSGAWKGKPIAGSFELNGLGFYGNGFELALRAMAKGGLASLKFPAVQIKDPIRAVVMELTREGSEAFGGREAIKVKFSMSGAMSVFWSAHLLIDDQGTVLRYTGNKGPGTPAMIAELVRVDP
jgi:hypothetical protein